MKPFGKVISAVLILALTVQTIVFTSFQANAVVNGEEISDAAKSKPWVAQIWYAESAETYYEPVFICTGSLKFLPQHIVY